MLSLSPVPGFRNVGYHFAAWDSHGDIDWCPITHKYITKKNMGGSLNIFLGHLPKIPFLFIIMFPTLTCIWYVYDCICI